MSIVPFSLLFANIIKVTGLFSTEVTEKILPAGKFNINYKTELQCKLIRAHCNFMP